MMCASTRNVLMVGSYGENAWLSRFPAAIGKFSQIDEVEKENVTTQFNEKSYDVVMVDETCLTGDYEFLQQILRLQPSVRVVVVTDTPEWRRARLAFQYGAVDYIPNTVDPDELKKIIQES